MSKPEIDIAALAKLARLDVSAADLAKLEQEIPSILHFVEQIQRVHDAAAVEAAAQRNVMRADGNAIESGTYTETLLSAAPQREGDRVVVKQVISRKKK